MKKLEAAVALARSMVARAMPMVDNDYGYLDQLLLAVRGLDAVSAATEAEAAPLPQVAPAVALREASMALGAVWGLLWTGIGKVHIETASWHLNAAAWHLEGNRGRPPEPQWLREEEDSSSAGYMSTWANTDM